MKDHFWNNALMRRPSLFCKEQFKNVKRNSAKLSCLLGASVAIPRFELFQVYHTVLSVCSGLDELETVQIDVRLCFVERLIKSSVLGLIIPPMLCLLCDRNLHTLNFSEQLLQV